MSNKTKILSITVVVLIAITGGFFALHRSTPKVVKLTSPTVIKPQDVNSVDYSGPTESQKQAGDATKSGSADNNTNPANASSSADQAGNISISRVSQAQGSNTVSLRTVTSGVGNGNCLATFSKAGETSIQRSSAIVNNATYLSCAPIDVPVSDFTASGSWNVNIYVVDSHNKVISNTATGNVEVTK